MLSCGPKCLQMLYIEAFPLNIIDRQIPTSPLLFGSQEVAGWIRWPSLVQANNHAPHSQLPSGCKCSWFFSWRISTGR